MLFATHIEAVAPRKAADHFFMGRLVIVDVRGEAEWAHVRVPGATHIPLGQLRRRLCEVRTDRPVAFLCRSGHRSAFAARQASRQRSDVSTIAGGMNAWLAAELPAARCAPPQDGSRTR